MKIIFFTFIFLAGFGDVRPRPETHFKFDDYMNFDLNAYEEYLDVQEPHVESLRVEVGVPGYAILNVTASGCDDPLADITIKVESCDGAKMIKEYLEKPCKDGGASVCLPSSFRERCVRVKSGGHISENLTLPRYQSFIHKEIPVMYTWHHHHDTKSSTLSMMKQSGAFFYSMKLKPDPVQSINDHQEKSCRSGDEITIDGAIHDDRVTFTASWDHLEPGCIYLSTVTPYNPCMSPYNHGQPSHDLSYVTSPQEQSPGENVVLEDWVVVLIVVLTTMVMILASIYLISTWKLRHHSLRTVEMDIDEQKQVECLKKDVQGPRILKEEQEESVKMKVLVVYAGDVKDEVASLITLLKHKTNYEILDLYDPLDLDKLSDGTMWLTRRLLDQDTITLLVASEEARKLQILLSSTLERGSHNLQDMKLQCTPQEGKNCKMTREVTPSQKTNLTNSVAKNKSSSVIFDLAFVQKINEKNVNDQENCSKVQAELKPDKGSNLEQHSLEEGNVRKEEEHSRKNSLLVSGHHRSSSVASECNNSKICSDCRNERVGSSLNDGMDSLQVGEIDTNDEGTKINSNDSMTETDVTKDGTEKIDEGEQVESKTIVDKKKVHIRQEKTKTRESTNLGCNNSSSSLNGKKNGGEEDELTGSQPASEADGEEVFHFLLVDFLLKLEASSFSQDYNRLYQIKLKETPGEVILDHVTPGRVYNLPGHLDHLLHALACSSTLT